jgi:hypothetical protein
VCIVIAGRVCMSMCVSVGGLGGGFSVCVCIIVAVYQTPVAITTGLSGFQILNRCGIFMGAMPVTDQRSCVNVNLQTWDNCS